MIQEIKKKIKAIVSEKYSEKNNSFIHNRYLDYYCGYSLASEALKAKDQEIDKLIKDSAKMYLEIKNENFKLENELKALMEDNERLKGLIEKLFRGAIKITNVIWDDIEPEKEWQQFKTENNL